MRRYLLPALALVLLASATPSDAASAQIASSGHGVVRGDFGPARGTPVELAQQTLDRLGGILDVDEATFGAFSVRRSILGVHVRGREVRGGVPVDETSAAIHVIDGRIVQVEARPSALTGEPSLEPIDQASAVDAALNRLGVSSPAREPRSQRLLVRVGNRLVDAWRVSVFSLVPAIAAEVDVSASDGTILAVRDATVHADGTATVFDPNPVQSTRNTALRQPLERGLSADADLDSPELTAALVTRPMKAYDPTFLPAGRILGPYVDVVGTGPVVGIDPNKFTFTRGDPRFETTMAYVHIDTIQRYFQSLGFTGDAAVNAEPQNVLTLRIEGFDNSFYSPSEDLIAFGTGGVDDAEDAEVIIHELGHAIHDAQVPGWGDEHEGGAMGEGWGDFLAGAYFARTSGGFGDPCIMDWDATTYSDDNPPCLRRLDRNKTYPKNMTGSVHADGEIWSAFLWNLRAKLGCTETDPSLECQSPRPPDAHILSDRVLKLVLASHELLTTKAKFRDAVAALITAAGALGHPEWVPLIRESAAKYGLPLS